MKKKKKNEYNDNKARPKKTDQMIFVVYLKFIGYLFTLDF